MLKSYEVQRFSVFASAKFNFSPALNVMVGENGTGKSHILKSAYSIISASAELGKRHGGEKPTKTLLQRRFADKLVQVMRPESLGRLVRRKQGRDRCRLSLVFADSSLNNAMSFATSSKLEVQVEQLPNNWHGRSPVFLPTREVLTIFPGFTSVYQNRYIEFDETYYDLCVLLGDPPLRGARDKNVAELLRPLEEAMGGRLVLSNNGRFYLSIPGQGNMEIYLVAEGIRKLAMVAQLIINGSVLDKGYLFWDEPEANLNPKLIKVVARTIMELCHRGLQVFIATHSLFLLKEFEILYKESKYKRLKKRYFSFVKKESDIKVEQGESIEVLDTLMLLDEDLAQYDRYRDVG